MKAVFLFVGKTTEKYIDDGVSIFLKRLMHYIPLEVKIIPSSSNSKKTIEEESAMLLNQLQARDFIVLLDEHGKQLTSMELSDKLSKWMLLGKQRLVFIIGGAYGISKEVADR